MKEKQKSIMYLGIKTPFAALIKVLKFITMSLISMLQCTHPSMYLCYLQFPYSITRLFWHYLAKECYCFWWRNFELLYLNANGQFSMTSGTTFACFTNSNLEEYLLCTSINNLVLKPEILTSSVFSLKNSLEFCSSRPYFISLK